MGELERSLAAELDDRAQRLLAAVDRHHVLERQRLEVEPVRGVVVRRDGLRVAVHHDRLVAGPPEGEDGVDAAVVELDPLADPVGPGAQDHHLPALRRQGLVLHPGRRVEVRGNRHELGGAGVDPLEDAVEPPLRDLAGHQVLPAAQQGGDPLIAQPAQPGPAEQLVRRGLEVPAGEFRFDLHDRPDLAQEPRVDVRGRGHLVDRPALAQRGEDPEEALPVGRAEPPSQTDRIADELLLARPRRLQFQAGETLHQRLAEVAADRHHLAHRLHRRAQGAGGALELLERPARDLDDRVVEGRLEGGVGLAGDVVRDLVQGVADRQLRGDLGDRKTGRLGRQGRTSRHPRVHLDHDAPPAALLHRELDVRTPGRDAHLADHGEGVVAHVLVLGIGQRLLRRHGDRVAGVHAHRIDVLDRADDDRVVGHVAHHFELELLPAQNRLLDQGGRGRTRLQGADDHVVDLVAVEHDAAALASQREARPDDDREAQAVDDPPRLFQRARDTALRHLETGLHHGPLEEQAVLAQAQRLDPRAEQLHPGLLERAGLFQRQGQVDPGLAADGRQQRVRPLALDDLHRHVGHEGFDVGRVRDLRVRHDRRRVRVDEDDPVALPAQDTAGLGAGVVELARLAYDDRPRTEDQDRLDVRPLRHERAECTGKPDAFPDRGAHRKTRRGGNTSGAGSRILFVRGGTEPQARIDRQPANRLRALAPVPSPTGSRLDASASRGTATHPRTQSGPAFKPQLPLSGHGPTETRFKPGRGCFPATPPSTCGRRTTSGGATPSGAPAPARATPPAGQATSTRARRRGG